MKASTILLIKNLLETQSELAEQEYDELRSNLEIKYETEWLDTVKEPNDSRKYEKARKKKHDLADALEDFEKHQW